MTRKSGRSIALTIANGLAHVVRTVISVFIFILAPIPLIILSLNSPKGLDFDGRTAIACVILMGGLIASILILPSKIRGLLWDEIQPRLSCLGIILVIALVVWLLYLMAFDSSALMRGKLIPIPWWK